MVMAYCLSHIPDQVITPLAALLVKLTPVGAFATPVNVTTAGYKLSLK